MDTLQASAPKSGDFTLTTTLKRDIATYDRCTQDQALPNELLALVFYFLSANKQLKTLASAAQTSNTIDDLVIPILYQKIRFTANNKDKLLYGSSPTTGAEDHGKSELNVHR